MPYSVGLITVLVILAPFVYWIVGFIVSELRERKNK